MYFDNILTGDISNIIIKNIYDIYNMNKEYTYYNFNDINYMLIYKLSQQIKKEDVIIGLDLIIKQSNNDLTTFNNIIDKLKINEIMKKTLLLSFYLCFQPNDTDNILILKNNIITNLKLPSDYEFTITRCRSSENNYVNTLQNILSIINKSLNNNINFYSLNIELLHALSIYKNIENFDFFSDLGKKISKGTTNVANQVGSGTTSAFTKTVTGSTNVFNTTVKGTTNAVAETTDVTNTTIKGTTDVTNTVVKGTNDVISETTDVTNTVVKGTTNVANIIGSGTVDVVDKIKDGTEGVIDKSGDFFKGPFSDFFGNIWGSISGWFFMIVGIIVGIIVLRIFGPMLFRLITSTGSATIKSVSSVMD